MKKLLVLFALLACTSVHAGKSGDNRKSVWPISRWPISRFFLPPKLRPVESPEGSVLIEQSTISESNRLISPAALIGGLKVCVEGAGLTPDFYRPHD